MNTKTEIEKRLAHFFAKWYGDFPDRIMELPHSGSGRIYYRIFKNNFTAIGAFNDNYNENFAFIDFTKQLLNSRINVPAIYDQKLTENIYLIQDLGDNQLLSWLTNTRKNNDFPPEAFEIYKKVIQQLIQIQIIAGRNFDYSHCYQHAVFDKNSILYDLEYFKSNYVDALALKYNTGKLISDFETFANYLLKIDNHYFMFRDFQARNIILKENVPYFIDYQGGRKGPLQYDLASLLFQAKAQIPEKEKIHLLEYYLEVVQMYAPVIADEFNEYFFAFAMIRVLQTLGAYGLRGLKEKKIHFIESIPFAKKNLIDLKKHVSILNRLKELNQVIEQIINTEINSNG